jgi:hypothetical protein
MSLQLRRIILAVISITVGVVLTYAIIYIRIPLGPVTFGFGTDVEHFALSNVVLLAISIACTLGIWLDFFMDTRILKS